MKTKAVRLYGQSDLRLEEFELPQIKYCPKQRVPKFRRL